MIDEELIESIRSMFDDSPALLELDKEEAKGLASSVASRYVSDTNKIWWWESLKSDSLVIDYGEEDGLNMLENLICNDKSVIIFITDDQPEPWCVLRGASSEILNVIKNQRFFEYFIVPEELNWIVFDTHHNSFVIAGSLMNKAENILKKK